MSLSKELQWRGFVNQTTIKDLTILDDTKLTFYWGVDPSADSMHVGQLAMAVMIKHFIDAGHKPILLVGGATGMIGDPDGKSDERKLLSTEQVEENKRGILSQFKTLFNDVDVELVDNYEWFKSINYLDFLRDVGKSFSMTQLLDRDFVQSRIGIGGNGISYAEFSYSLIQGYDFLHLYRKRGVTLQIAGADQWGNSISGVELLRKKESVEAHVWTAPLIINKTTGKKFGKSEAGAVWLDDKKTSPYEFYQFWLNVDDKGVIDYLKIYTMLPEAEIDEIAARHKVQPEKRIAQKILASKVTTMVHGSGRTNAVEQLTDILFGKSTIDTVDDSTIDFMKRDIATVALGGQLVDALTDGGFVSSKGEARRLIAGGGVKINDIKITQDVLLDQRAVVRIGKNQFLLVA